MTPQSDKPIMMIMPDIHGRNFWMSAVIHHPELPIVFLGDYLDPYTYTENITPDEAWFNFLSILRFKKNHMKTTILLLGNHDIHYFDSDLYCSRKDNEHYDYIHRAFVKNINLFHLSVIVQTKTKRFLLTHAGVIPGWLKHRMPSVDTSDAQAISMELNKHVISEQSITDFAHSSLMDVSATRMGSALYASPIWADVEDHKAVQDTQLDAYQIFGHTQQESQPVITEHYACLDCRRPFMLTEQGNIIDMIY